MNEGEESKYGIYSVHELKKPLRRVEWLKNRANYESKSSHALLWSTIFVCEDTRDEAEGLQFLKTVTTQKQSRNFSSVQTTCEKLILKIVFMLKSLYPIEEGCECCFFLLVVCPSVCLCYCFSLSVQGGLKE